MLPPSPVQSPFLAEKPRKFQFSLGSLLLAMVIFSTMSASLLWASRLPLVSNELNAWMGTVPSTNRDGSDRRTQLMFLILCYSSPLLMAATLNLLLFGFRTLERFGTNESKPDDKQWEM